MSIPGQEDEGERRMQELRARLSARRVSNQDTPQPQTESVPSDKDFLRKLHGLFEKKQPQRPPTPTPTYQQAAERSEQRKDQHEQLRSLGSGEQLNYDYQLQQFILRPGQRRLWNVLDDYNTYRLLTCVEMQQDRIIDYVQRLDQVPDEVLEMVAEQLSIEQREIIDKNQPKLITQPRFADLARKCMAALNVTKELEELHKKHKRPIRRAIL